MQRHNEGYDNIEVVDGVSKSAILKGNTLVNVDSYYSKDDFVDKHILNLTDDGWIELVANGNYRNAFTRFNGMIKPNTKYLAVVEVKENTLVNETLPERPFYLFTNFSNSDGEVVVPFVDQTRWISQGQKGLFKYILTSRGDLSTTTINLRNFVSNTTTSGRIIYRTMLIEYVEGMENWDIPFFRGIQYVKMPVLRTTGKNLIGECVNPLERHKRYKSFLEPNKNYTLSYKNSDGSSTPNGRIYLVNGDVEIANYGYVNQKEFIAPSTTTNETMVVIDSWGHDLSVLLVNEKLSFSLDLNYIKKYPYKTNTLSTPEDLELRGIGDVKDELNVAAGEVVQKFTTKTYNGSENWALHATSSNLVNCLHFYVLVDNLKKNSIPVSDRYVGSTYSEKRDEEFISVGGSYHLHLNILQSRLEDGTVNSLKKYLSQNPITVQYELDTPVVKTVDLSIVDQNGGTQENLHSFANGHLQVSSEVENSLLPSVQYEIPTKNSYHMDLMKTNTLYTMKAKTVSVINQTFYILQKKQFYVRLTGFKTH